MNWQLQDAKNRLSQLVRKTQTDGPQVITIRGREAAVLLSIDEYRRLTRGGDGLVQFLQSSPWAHVELDLDRSRELGRDITL